LVIDHENDHAILPTKCPVTLRGTLGGKAGCSKDI
jgi:hypothetical protein